MNEARMCQLRALLDERLGKMPRVRPRLVEAGIAPKRKPQRATAEASVTEATLCEETSMKTVREPKKKVKPAEEPTLFGAKLSEMTEGDLAEIRLICVKAMARVVCQDLRAAIGPNGRPAFRVIDGGLSA